MLTACTEGVEFEALPPTVDVYGMATSNRVCSHQCMWQWCRLDVDTIRAGTTHRDVGSRVRHTDAVQQFPVGGVAPHAIVEPRVCSTNAVQHVAVAVGGAGTDGGPRVHSADALRHWAGVRDDGADADIGPCMCSIHCMQRITVAVGAPYAHVRPSVRPPNGMQRNTVRKRSSDTQQRSRMPAVSRV